MRASIRIWSAIALAGAVALLSPDRASATPPASEVEPAVERAVRERRTLPDDVRVVVGDIRPSDPRTWAKAVQVEHLELPPGESGERAVTAIATVRDAQGKSERLFLLARVDVERPIVVAATALARGAAVQAKDVRVEWRSELGRPALQRIEDALGKQLRAPMRPGDPLDASLLQSPPVLARGDDVAIEVRGRGFTVSAPGEAMQSGGVGDMIRVKVRPTGKVVEARVTSASAVLLTATPF